MLKENILDTAAQKIQLYGLKKFTIDEIAEELKISKKTIYKYFSSKDEIISEYFNTIIENDKNSVTLAMEQDNNFFDKLHLIIYSYHKFRLPMNVVEEARKFYPTEWEKIQELKQFKLNSMSIILKQGVENGVIKDNANFKIISMILEKVSDGFFDYEFLSENKMTMNEAIDEVMDIILKGILKQAKENNE